MSNINIQSSMLPLIGFFGIRNAGKSSVVNAVTNQTLSIVSDTAGTTTDPVQKAMELLPLGPVVIIDTPGFDDEGELGALRVKRTGQILNKIDIAVLIVDITSGISQTDKTLISLFKSKNLPYITAYNKSDLLTRLPLFKENELAVSAKSGFGIEELKEKIAHLISSKKDEKLIIGDKLNPGDIVILVIPIDESAPKGRIILPQQNVLREVLDANATAICVQPSHLKTTLAALNKKPRLVITDSQAFNDVAKDVPSDIILTSFSILLSKYKGYLSSALSGISAIQNLTDSSSVLISEGCTHHRQCNDIGTVKIPALLRRLSGKSLSIKTSSGNEFPEDLSGYDLIVHCGGCMINEREMSYRVRCSFDQGVPLINYGMLFAYANGILERSLEIFSI